MRFTAITIENFKNVEHGELSFVNKRRPDGPSILALYGQNGSGKSALVDCMTLFKALMGNRAIPNKFASYITKGAPSARITYELETADSIKPYCHIKYEVEIAPYVYEGRADGEPEDAPSSMTNQEMLSNPGLIRAWLRPDGVKAGDNRVRILSETLSYSIPGVSRMRAIFSTKNTESFKPSSIRKSLIGEGALESGLRQIRDAFYDEGRSCLFIFCDDTASLFCGGCRDQFDQELYSLLLFDSLIASALQGFAWTNLYVVGTREAEALEGGSMQLYANQDSHLSRIPEFNPDDPESMEYWNNREQQNDGIWEALFFGDGTLTVSTDADNPLPLSDVAAEIVCDTLNGINELISAIIPGMFLQLHRSEQRLLDESSPAYVESCREGRSIPLSCESRGVQKLVSVAWLLVSVYNSSLVTAVIDELDSGIFEYLLGEILRVVSEGGKGQLIFTSHNLRPLEVLDKGYIAFTTSDPKKRYIRMKNVKTTNNLRDLYYRSILLGGQDESIYEPSTNGEITLAFIRAGEDIARTHDRLSNAMKEDWEDFYPYAGDEAVPAIADKEGDPDA